MQSAFFQIKKLQSQEKQHDQSLIWEPSLYESADTYRVSWSSVHSRGHKYFWIVACTGYLDRQKMTKEHKIEIKTNQSAKFIMFLQKVH
jgi:hypothetical protein